MISSPLYILGGVAYEAVPCRVHGVVLRKAARKKMQEGTTRMKNGRQQVLKNSRWRNMESKGKATSKTQAKPVPQQLPLIPDGTPSKKKTKVRKNKLWQSSPPAKAPAAVGGAVMGATNLRLQKKAPLPKPTPVGDGDIFEKPKAKSKDKGKKKATLSLKELIDQVDTISSQYQNKNVLTEKIQETLYSDFQAFVDKTLKSVSSANEFESAKNVIQHHYEQTLAAANRKIVEIGGDPDSLEEWVYALTEVKDVGLTAYSDEELNSIKPKVIKAKSKNDSTSSAKASSARLSNQNALEIIENSDIASTFEEFKQELMEGDLLPGQATLEMQSAIRMYTGQAFMEMNEILRKPNIKKFTQQEKEAYNAVSALAADGLGKLPPYKGIVYRGTSLTRKQQAQYIPGAIVQDAGFVSAACSNFGAFAGNTQYVIQSHQGVDVDKISANEGEKEVLFAPNTKFKVTGVERENLGSYSQLTVYMEEIYE